MQSNLLKKTFTKSSLGFSYKNSVLHFGYFGIKSCTYSKLTIDNVNYLIRFIERHIKLIITTKKVRFWNRIEINKTLTKLSTESRMGKGKGGIYSRFNHIYPGQILFEFEKMNEKDWTNLFLKIRRQLSFTLKSIKKTY